MNTKHVFCMCPLFHSDARRCIIQVKRERSIEDDQEECDAELKAELQFMIQEAGAPDDEEADCSESDADYGDLAA